MTKTVLHLLPVFLLAAPAVQAATGVCVDDDEHLLLAIMTHDNGKVIDLAVTVDDKNIYRYPEAGLTQVLLGNYRYTFSAAQKGKRPAIRLELDGRKATLTLHDKISSLECNWQ